jgi:polyphosphate kinase 2 (PPK2 family)
LVPTGPGATADAARRPKATSNASAPASGADALDPSRGPTHDLGALAGPKTGAAELPAVGRAPRAKALEPTLAEVTGAFAATRPTSLEAAIGMLGALGFEVEKAKSGRARLQRGEVELRIEDVRLGSTAAFELELEGPRNGKKDEERRVAVGGALVSKAVFARMREKYEDVLDDFHDALEEAGKRPLPRTFDQLKTFIDGAKSPKAQAAELAEDAEVAAGLDALATRLGALRAEGRAPERVVVYTDGPDGAGKSSTGAILMRALAKAGFDTDVAVFKAPSAAEKQQHWLQRFRDKGVPPQAGDARFWDRGPAGDAVYGKKSPAEAKLMAAELRAFEAQLADEGVLLFKAHIFAAPERSAETFGKRLARRTAADELELRLAAKGQLDDPTRAALDNIRSRIDEDDFDALASFPDVQARFLRFSKLADYTVVDATDRHEARLALVDALSSAVEAYAERGA